MTTETAVDFRNTNALWASVLVETLARCGLRRAVISPGSRSTPLTIAFARHALIETTPVLDERSAAFFALGLAKVDLQPVVLVCTSGTAAANYFPAVIEAHESGVPLLVLTADRPPELRACASGQTIDQLKLYGGYVSFFHELAVPELDLPRLRYLRQVVRHAWDRTTRPQAGPVHLNAPFRDPLPPLADGGVAEAFGRTVDWAHFFGQLTPMPGNPDLRVDEPARAPFTLSPEVHGLIVVGPNQPAAIDTLVEEMGSLARRLGWPVLADGLSPLRNHAGQVPNLVTTYDTILRNPAAAGALKPEVVVAIGGWPTSKVLRSWLEASDVPIWLLTERIDDRDALHGRTVQGPASIAALVASLPEPAEPGNYATTWLRYEQRAREALDARLRLAADIVEPKVAWLVAQFLPAETPLFIANSMPIRDVEYFWPAGHARIRPLCNRGANGIDGTLSTALGVAHASGRPAVMLTGDLALLHDTNGFLLGGRVAAGLTIILVNNHGGGIFEHLPVAKFDPPFEEYFATPQEADFGRLCAAYGVEHIVVTDWSVLVPLVSDLPPTGIRVLELRTDRKADAALRKQWFAEVAALMGQ